MGGRGRGRGRKVVEQEAEVGRKDVVEGRLANQSLKLGFRDWGGNPPEHGNIFLKHRCSMI